MQQQHSSDDERDGHDPRQLSTDDLKTFWAHCLADRFKSRKELLDRFQQEAAELADWETTQKGNDNDR